MRILQIAPSFVIQLANSASAPFFVVMGNFVGRVIVLCHIYAWLGWLASHTHAHAYGRQITQTRARGTRAETDTINFVYMSLIMCVLSILHVHASIECFQERNLPVLSTYLKGQFIELFLKALSLWPLAI